ncbi:MAG: hypothetical protein ACI9BC_003102, partial [Crocinitomicaceae bacterium]
MSNARPAGHQRVIERPTFALMTQTHAKRIQS